MEIVKRVEVRLDDRHAELIKKLEEYVRKENPLVIRWISMKTRNDSKEIFKLKIMSYAARNKISEECASKLCWLVDEISRLHPNEEERKNVTYEVFRLVRMFAKGKRK
jgi:hypothetical protein